MRTRRHNIGAWLVEVTFGCINTPGRRVRYLASDEAHARRLVRQSLRHRATAKKRIGVSSRFRELNDPRQWLPLLVE